MMQKWGSFAALTRFERGLWVMSLIVVGGSFLLGGSSDWLTLVASLIGVTALIFVSAGYPLGQLLTMAFALVYAVISFDLRYYGEMITYVGMSAPIAGMAMVEWLRHPYRAGSAEVKVARMTARQRGVMWLMTAAVTFAFYFVLKAFGNASLFMSTVSISTSFLASWLMLRRNPAYALAYAANDLVLIVLWVQASLIDTAYVPMVVCFVMFFVNDMYGFINWRRMMRRQGCE